MPYDEIVKRLREVADEVGNDYDVDPYNAEQRCLAILQAADAIEELSKCVDESIPKGDVEIIIEELSKPKWIPVTERLPKDDAVCIITNGVSNAIGYRGKVFGWHLIWTDYLTESEVTHWMPLPQPPKEG